MSMEIDNEPIIEVPKYKLKQTSSTKVGMKSQFSKAMKFDLSNQLNDATKQLDNFGFII